MQIARSLNFDPLPSQHHGLFKISAAPRPSPLLWARTQNRFPVICARKANRRSGHQRLAKILPKLAFSVASDLNLLPEPLALILAELGGTGDGGGGDGSWKGFGGGGGGGWGRRRGKGMRSSLVVLGWFLVSGVAVWLFAAGKADKDLIIGVLGSFVVAAVLLQGFGRGARDWLLGFCIFGGGVALGMRRDELQKLAQKQGISLQLSKGRGGIRRRRRRRQSSRLW